MHAGTEAVLHLVGRVTDDVIGFLGPATEALAQTGVAQVVVLLDEPRQRHVLPVFNPAVELLLTPMTGGALRRWLTWARAVRQQLRLRAWSAVHLHGLFPCLIGAALVRMGGLPVRLYYSPHGSKSMRSTRVVAGYLLRVLGGLTGAASRSAISNAGSEAELLSGMIAEPVALVESPVAAVFFDTERHEARRPLIVTSRREGDPRNAEVFAQIAVLLNGEALDLSFNWLGTVDAESESRLRTSNVGVFDVSADTEKASRMAAGWVYLACGNSRGFPLYLAEAMAVGLPCIALDSPHHRDLLRHGQTGFLCRDVPEIETCLAMLIDNPALRESIGQAARAEARRRFSAATFQSSLREAYALPPA